MSDKPITIEEVIAEILEAEESGPVDYEAILKRYPDQAAAIREFLDDRRTLGLSRIKQRSDWLDVAALHPQRNDSITPQQIRYFGDYELLSEVARGGMGVVYRARQTSLNRIVAVKMILSGSFASKADVLRFRTEAEAAGRLSHPNIVPVYEVGEYNEQHYFSMAFVEGQSLDRILSDGPLSPRRAAEMLLKLSHALTYAHDKGVIHRDLKPSNVLVDNTNQPHVTDFGLAKNVDAAGPTTTGQLLGTPAYMAPEQAAASADITVRTDVYGLGTVLYSMLTGMPPFQTMNPLETLLQVREKDPVRPSQLQEAIPADLDVICLKCLEKDPYRRYRSAAELADDLSRFLDGYPIAARRVTPIEKVTKWIRRKPVVASLIALVAIVSLIGLSGILWQWNQAMEARLNAEQNAQDALSAQQIAVEQADHLRMAQHELRQELQRSNLLRSDSLLDNGAEEKAEELLWHEHLQTDPGEGLNSLWRLMRLYATSPQVNRVLPSGFAPICRNGKLAFSKDNQVYVYDATTLEPLSIFESPYGSVFQPALSNEGRWLACGHLNGREVLVWDLDNPQSEPRTLLLKQQTRRRSLVETAVLSLAEEQVSESVQRELDRLMITHPAIAFVDESQLLVRVPLGIESWRLDRPAATAESTVLYQFPPSASSISQRIEVLDGSSQLVTKQSFFAEFRDSPWMSTTAFYLADLEPKDSTAQTLVWHEGGVMRIPLEPKPNRSSVMSFLVGQNMSAAFQIDCDAVDIINPNASCISLDGRWLATLRSPANSPFDHPASLFVVDLAEGSVVVEIEQPESPIGELQGITFSPDHKHLVALGNGRYTVFALPSGQTVYTASLLGNTPQFPKIEFVSNEQFVIGSADPYMQGLRLGVYSVRLDPVITTDRPLSQLADSGFNGARWIRLGPDNLWGEYDGRELHISSSEGPARLSRDSVPQASSLGLLRRSDQLAEWAFFDSGNRLLLAISGKRNALVCVDWRTGEELWKVDLDMGDSPQGSMPVTILNDPSTQRIVVLMGGGIVALVDPATRQVVRKIQLAVQPRASCIALSSDGHRLAACGVKVSEVDKKDAMSVSEYLTIIDLENNQDSMNPGVQTRKLDYRCRAITFAQDDRCLAVANSTASVDLIDPNDLASTAVLATGQQVSSIAADAQLPLLAVGTQGGEIQFWNLADRFPLASFSTKSLAGEPDSPIERLIFDSAYQVRFTQQTRSGRLNLEPLRQRVESNRNGWVDHLELSRSLDSPR